MDTFKLKFIYENRNPIIFTYRINKSDYETFYVIVQDFFNNELDEDELDIVFKVFPELKSHHDTLSKIFNKTFIVVGIKGIEDIENIESYEIQYI